MYVIFHKITRKPELDLLEAILDDLYILPRKVYHLNELDNSFKINESDFCLYFSKITKTKSKGEKLFEELGIKILQLHWPPNSDEDLQALANSLQLISSEHTYVKGVKLDYLYKRIQDKGFKVFNDDNVITLDDEEMLSWLILNDSIKFNKFEIVSYK